MATVPIPLFPARDTPAVATAATASPVSAAPLPLRDAQAPADSIAAVADGGCFHCGQALPAQPVRVQIDGAERAVCCDGCGAAARWIRDAGLVQYYRLRQSEAARVDPDAGDFREWMQPDVLAEQSWPVAGGLAIVVLADGLRCAACAWLIDQALLREDGVLDVAANAVSGRIRLSWDPQRVDLCVLLQRLAALGFAPGLSGGSAREQARRRESRRDLLRLGLAGLGAMQAMMFAEALYLDTAAQMPLATRDFLRWITLLVSTPVVFVAGWPFLAGLFRDLRERNASMDVLVGSSILIAYAASVVATLRGGAQVWFDAAVMFVFLLLAARQLEQWARRRAVAQADALARARPAFARRERADGTSERVALGQVQPGDVLQVAAGEALPADGELLDAQAELDESLLTGESLPVRRLRGETLAAGSLCRGAPLRLRVQRSGNATRLAELVRLVGQAQTQRPRLVRAADRVARHFVIALFVAAVLVFAAWWQWQPQRAFEITLAVLVISCPCALSLALPAALAAATDALARRGVLVLRADALETLAAVDTLVLDKTGTLTTAAFTLEQVDTFDGLARDTALTMAAALQCDPTHPLATAFPREAGDWTADARRIVAGQGVEGHIGTTQYRLGRAEFAAARADDGAVWLGDGTRAFARFVVRQPLRADAAEAVAAFRRLGVALEIASGDAPEAVAATAQSLGIAHWRARQTPEDKLARAEGLQREGHVVAMLGDGINDAPVLAGASVSFAFAGGAALTHRAADFVLAGDSLTRIAEAIALARRTRRVMRQSLAWAVIYNALALPFAALGWIAPWLAALGMTCSSLLVVLNALRLVRKPA